jgi:hypothetical protein
MAWGKLLAKLVVSPHGCGTRLGSSSAYPPLVQRDVPFAI